MKVLVTGINGQVGGALIDGGAPAGVTFLAAGRDRLDLSDASAIAQAMRELAPDLVVNCAAYTAVDKAETERDAAFAVNATAPGILAAEAAARGAPIIHLSTDYVFDGSGNKPWKPQDKTAPINVYGASKEAGEQAVRAANPKHLILRTSWVYAARGANFVRTMLRLGAERDELRVVADQRGCPTCADDIAAGLATLSECLAAGAAMPWGTWHFAGRGATTWHGLADAAFELAAPIWGRRPNLVPIDTADYPTPARRPGNSELDCIESEAALGISPRPWREALSTVVAKILA